MPIGADFRAVLLSAIAEAVAVSGAVLSLLKCSEDGKGFCT